MFVKKIVFNNIKSIVNKKTCNIYIKCRVGIYRDWIWTDVIIVRGWNSTGCINVPDGVWC